MSKYLQNTFTITDFFFNIETPTSLNHSLDKVLLLYNLFGKPPEPNSVCSLWHYKGNYINMKARETLAVQTILYTYSKISQILANFKWI